MDLDRVLQRSFYKDGSQDTKMQQQKQKLRGFWNRGL